MTILVVLVDLGGDFGGFAGFGGGDFGGFAGFWGLILVVLLDLGDDFGGFVGFGRTTLSRNQLSR